MILDGGETRIRALQLCWTAWLSHLKGLDEIVRHFNIVSSQARPILVSLMLGPHIILSTLQLADLGAWVVLNCPTFMGRRQFVSLYSLWAILISWASFLGCIRPNFHFFSYYYIVVDLILFCSCLVCFFILFSEPLLDLDLQSCLTGTFSNNSYILPRPLGDQWLLCFLHTNEKMCKSCHYYSMMKIWCSLVLYDCIFCCWLSTDYWSLLSFWSRLHQLTTRILIMYLGQGRRPTDFIQEGYSILWLS